LKPLVDVVVDVVVVVFEVEDLLLPPQPAATEHATTRTPSAIARPPMPARYEIRGAVPRGQVRELNGRHGMCTHASTDWHIGQRSGGVERATP
jgi:hypothetical protein